MKLVPELVSSDISKIPIWDAGMYGFGTREQGYSPKDLKRETRGN